MNTEKKLNAMQDAYEGKPTCVSCGRRMSLDFFAMNWKDEWYCHYCWERTERLRKQREERLKKRAERLKKRAKVAKTASKARSDEKLNALRDAYEAMRKERDALQATLERSEEEAKII